MNAGMVFAFHSSVEETLRRAGNNPGVVSEFLLFRKYSEAFDKVFLFSTDSKSFSGILPENFRQVKLRNSVITTYAKWKA